MTHKTLELHVTLMLRLASACTVASGTMSESGCPSMEMMFVLSSTVKMVNHLIYIDIQ